MESLVEALQNNLNRIYQGDASVILRDFEDGCIDLVVTSPPYDTLRKYKGSGEQWNNDKFCDIAKELTRVLKDGGVIVWNVGDKTENGSETCTSMRQALYFVDECGLNLNDTMIWRKTNSMPQVKQPRYNQCFEYMYVFSKGKPKTFNPIMVPCKCAGQKYDSTAKNIDGESGRHKLTYNVNSEKVADNVWDFAVAQNKGDKTHPAVFPLELPIRHIKSWTNKGDIVLDPFCGSGTTLIAAENLGRKWIGIDIEKEYCDMTTERLNGNA